MSNERTWWKDYHPNKCEGQPLPIPYTAVEIWPNLLGINYQVRCSVCNFRSWHDLMTYKLYLGIVESVKSIIALQINGAPWIGEKGAGDISLKGTADAEGSILL